MLGCASILAIAIFTLVNGKQQPTPWAKVSKLPAIQKQFNHGTMMTHTLSKLPKLAVTHIAGSSLRQTEIPEIKHKKKAGQGYEKGSPLYDKQKKHKAAEVILPASPTGRQRPNLTVVLGCMFVGVMVIIIAACVNRDFLVRRHFDSGDLPVSPPPPVIKSDFDVGRPPPVTSSTRYDYNPGFQPVRAQVDYADPIPKSTRLDATIPPQQVALPQARYGEASVSMMPSKQPSYPPMQKLVSMPPSGNSPPGSQAVLPPQPASPSQTQQIFMQNTAPSGAIYASMPPQQPAAYLPPPRSYSTMPPNIN